MKRMKRAVALFVTAMLLPGLVPGLAPVVLAAPMPVYISIVSYESGTLKISWDGTALGTDAIHLIYHTPGTDGITAVPHDESLPAGARSAQVSGLRDNFIYDIRVQMLSGGLIIGEGLLYFNPGITFTALPVKEPVEDGPDDFDPPYNPAGGREIGTKPRLDLSWTMPRVFDGAQFSLAADCLPYMQGQINGIYKENRLLSRLNYRINISTNANDMSLSDAVIVDGLTNKAHVSGYESDKADVNTSGNSMGLTLQGRASETAGIPETAGSVLGHRDIYPGTMYYMTVQLVFDSYADAVVMHGGSSPLQGKPYTYTFIRFQLSKDDANNIYAMVYTINQGSVVLPDLYYEVQSNTADSQYGWEAKARLDPDYFKDTNGNFLEFGLIPILGVSANNNLYYRIVVTSSGSDAIRSQNLPYRMAQDKSRPPLPKGIAIDRRVLVTGEIDGKIKKSTDITLSWDQPLNWNEIKNNTDPANDVYFCIMLSTGQTEITQPPFPPLEEEDGTRYEGSQGGVPVKYRLVRYINARTALLSSSDSDRLIEVGGRLQYTLEGFELFKWVDAEGALQGVLQDFPASLPDGMKPESGYPSHLLSNTVYYMQMYTTKGTPGSAGSISERSVTVSFTTRSASGKDVPLPSNFMPVQKDGNQAQVIDGKVINTVRLQFDTVSSIQWADYDSTPQTVENNRIYYDLYMSTGTDPNTFKRIGSTDPALEDTQNNVMFEFKSEGLYQYAVATVSRFTKGDALSAFGGGLTPNTTYYFKIKTRLVMPDSTPSMLESGFTQMVPVTTVRGPMAPPDDKDRMPVAPADFSIAKDKGGNLLLTGTDVTFEWKRQESDVTYTLICTSARIPMQDQPLAYINDPVYRKFIEAYGITGNSTIGIVLDPGLSPGSQPAGFEYDNTKKVCRFTVNKGLFPNSLYYFSIRAERKPTADSTEKKISTWVSIPVTTLLIEAPLSLTAVNSSELGFYFTDQETDIRTEDYFIYIKGPKDREERLVTRSQASIVRDGKTVERNGLMHYVYYVRLYNLERNATYSTRVCRKNASGTMTDVYRQTGAATRDAVHEIEVKWKGRAGAEYELAIKPAEAVDYETLANGDLQSYMAVDGISYPYYIEENTQTSSSDECWYFAKIKTMPVRMSDGRVEHRPLKSNTKYYIKVRAVKKAGNMPPAFSKYTGPVDTRTDFDQDDYDRDEDNKDKEIKFLDRIKALEEGLFWRIAIGNGSSNKVLLKGDRAVNFVQNAGRFPMLIDISAFAADVDSDMVYIPADVVRALNAENQSFTIRTADAEFSFRPSTLDMESIAEAVSMKGKNGVKDLFFKLDVKRSDKTLPAGPSGAKGISRVNDFGIRVLGVSRTDEALRDMIRDRIYNEKTGFVKQKLDILADLYKEDTAGYGGVPDAMIRDMVKHVENEVSYCIRDILEGTTGVNGMILTSEDLKAFGDPLMVKLAYRAQKGMKTPYAYYTGSASWQKAGMIADAGGSITFNALKPGRYAIFEVGNAAADIPDGHWAKESIEKLMAKFDLSDVFTGINRSVNPSMTVSVKEAILLYEKLMDKAGENTGLDIRQKAKKLGLDGFINAGNMMQDVSRQEMAGLILKMYAQRTGADIGSLKPAGNINIQDEEKIGDRYYPYVVLAVDLGVMTLDGSGNFAPGASMNRAGVMAAAVRLLELTGDL